MRSFLSLLLVLCAFFLIDCQSNTQESTSIEQNQSFHKKHHRRHQQRDSHPLSADYHQANRSSDLSKARQQNPQIPKNVYDVLAYVRANDHAMDGYVGGRRFGNFENHLPRSSPDGKAITYQEWDINPKMAGKNRGTERLITGSDGRAWYTNDHYNTFTEVK